MAADVLGPILKRASSSLSVEDMMVLDRVLTATGESLYQEQGVEGGYANSEVMGIIDSYSNELVKKSDLSPEESMVALLESHPELYDQYLSESR